MDIFKKKTEIELAIWNIDRNYKVPTETIVRTIYDLHLKEFPDNGEYEEDDNSTGYDYLTFNHYSNNKGGLIFSISREIADIMDIYEVKIELSFEDIGYPEKLLREYGNNWTSLEAVLQDPVYIKIKDIIPDQFKVRTKTGPY